MFMQKVAPKLFEVYAENTSETTTPYLDDGIVAVARRLLEFRTLEPAERCARWHADHQRWLADTREPQCQSRGGGAALYDPRARHWVRENEGPGHLIRGQWASVT